MVPLEGINRGLKRPTLIFVTEDQDRGATRKPCRAKLLAVGDLAAVLRIGRENNA